MKYELDRLFMDNKVKNNHFSHIYFVIESFYMFLEKKQQQRV